VGRRIELYWGVRTEGDLYLQDLLARWQAERPNFRYVPVLSEVGADDPWPGRRGFVHQALLADHPNLSGHEVYACGSVRMVQAAVPDFLAHGLGEQFCFSDAFVPSARPAAPG
jgi:NAD(P)H-flavin reductase